MLAPRVGDPPRRENGTWYLVDTGIPVQHQLAGNEGHTSGIETLSDPVGQNTRSSTNEQYDRESLC